MKTKIKQMLTKPSLFVVLLVLTFAVCFGFSNQTQAATATKKVYLGKFKLTAYCPCRKCNGKYVNQKTAFGTRPKQGRTIAVDRKKIKLGSKVYFNGHTYTAEDTGGAIKGKRIDVFLKSHKKCMKFGVKRNVKVYKVVKVKVRPVVSIDVESPSLPEVTTTVISK